MSVTRDITIVVNGQESRATVPARKLLSDFLREDLGLTGTHIGCEHGVCGACTVLLEEQPVRSCLLFAAQMDGARIETIESLGHDADELDPMQQAFWDHHGAQCGFCTPGLILTAKALLAEVAHPNEAQVRDAISGNVCRCTGYVFVVEAIMAAALAQNGAGEVGDDR